MLIIFIKQKLSIISCLKFDKNKIIIFNLFINYFNYYFKIFNILFLYFNFKKLILNNE